jgi:poly(hydroxyalkanoate) depolymerase family esterase
MQLIDWRSLYAANRATIGGAVTPEQQDTRTFSIAGRDRRALVHLPVAARAGTAVPLVCMLHGCTQDPASFAFATQMNAAADRHGFAVVYPQQERTDNQNCCWNWFLAQHQARGGGEPHWIAAIARELVHAEPDVEIDAGRVFVAGLSAGGAMAAVMAATYPDVFAAVAVHSGLQYRAATNMIGAFAAMAGRGPSRDDGGDVVHAAMGTLARPMPLMTVHGGADATVSPSNGDRLLEQFMTANHIAAPATCDFDTRRPTTTWSTQVDGGYSYTRSQWTDRGGALMHESLRVDGMGHAWSGGARGGAWTDPKGPDASEAIWRFFDDSTRPTAPRSSQRRTPRRLAP